jgi:hypothetical protein
VSTKTKKATKAQQKVALEAVAAFLGPLMGHEGSAPTGKDAAYQGRGPELLPDYEGVWTAIPPTPTIMLEGGPEDWAIHAAADEVVRDTLRKAGLWAEPLTSYALLIHRFTD